jgi:taurine dioxygenase
MIKYKLHHNGWTVFADINLSKALKEDLYDLLRLCAHYTCVIIPNQDLSIEQEIKILKTFKDPYIFYPPTHPDFKHFTIDDEGYLLRVTAQKNEFGRVGVTGHKSEGLWHNEHPAFRYGSDVLWLYGLVGTDGSVTQFNNSILAFNDLDADTKNKIKDLKCIYYGGVNMSVERSDENFKNRKIYEDKPVPLVVKNPSGQTGLHFSLFQFERFEGMNRDESMEIAEPLFNFMTSEKYLYTHEWQDKDSLFGDQWLSVHRRLGFEGIESRILHKGTFNYPNDIDYSLLPTRESI